MLASSGIAPQDFRLGPDFAGAISPELAAEVASDDERQWWQSVSLPVATGSDVTLPGIVVGQQLLVPEAGAYAIYFAYDLGASRATRPESGGMPRPAPPRTSRQPQTTAPAR